jgi:hypothetical protein
LSADSIVGTPVILAPSYGDNYDVGYIGFTSPVTQQDVISVGIAYFENYHRLSDISVTHAFIVTGENTCIEALMGKGVVEDPLQAYFNDPKTHIFFRKPADYTRDTGHRIAESARPELGKKYDDLLIAAYALRGSFFGRFVQDIFGKAPTTDLNDFLHTNGRWICSELAAHCMDVQPEYHRKGVLADGDFTIDPQELFEDEIIFTPWHQGEAPGALVGSSPGSSSKPA